MELMPAMIEVTDLQPAARLWASGDVQLVVAQHRVALGSEGLAQLSSTGGFAGAEGWSEVFRQGLALDLADQGRDGGLGCGCDGGQPRPAGGEAAGDAHHLQRLLQLAGNVVAEAISKKQHLAGCGGDGSLLCRRRQAAAGDGFLEAAGGVIQPDP